MRHLLLSFIILSSCIINAQNQASFSSSSFSQNLCTNGDSIFFTADYDTTGVYTGNGITDYGNGTASYSDTIANLGMDTVKYTVIDTIGNAKVSLGDGHSAFIWKNRIYMTGENNHGQLGNGSVVNTNTPIKLGLSSNWNLITSSYASNLAINNLGVLWAWGNNIYGQLGDGTNIDRDVPVQIGNDSTWKYAVIGQLHSVSIKLDGSLWAWGYNRFGSLGDGTTNNSNSPIQIGQDSTWKIVKVFSGHSLALKNDGTLWAWGYNRYGNLGDGTTINRNSPIQIGQDTTWKDIAAGGGFSIAIKTDGSLWAWGRNNFYQLGDGTTTDQFSPIQIGQDTLWQSISAGDSYCIAIKKNGTLWGWGKNDLGQLGDGTSTNRSTAIQIGQDSSWSKVFAGRYHSAASKQDGSLWIWGLNRRGGLGVGLANNVFKTNHTQLIVIDTNSTFKIVRNISFETTVTQVSDSLYSNDSTSIYQWIDCGNGDTAITGENGRGFRPNQNGTYAVALKNGNCTDTSSCFQVLLTNIDGYNRQLNPFIIYPNPANNLIRVQLMNAEAGSTLFISDLTGKENLRHKITSPLESIDVSSLAKGVYILRYEGRVEKLIISE